MTYTPGPWRESPHDPVTHYGDIDNAILAPDGMRLASIYGGKEMQPALPLPTFAEARSNARLIAAAPEMYECLRDLLAVMNGDIGGPAQENGVIDEARALVERLETSPVLAKDRP